MVMLMWITVVLLSPFNTGSAQMNFIDQPHSVIAAASGDNVTLDCLRTKGNTEPIVWYKQAAGQEPRVMLTVHKLAQEHIFEDEFKSSRFSVEDLKESCHLKITNVEPSDEATYYCGLKIITITFGKGTFLSVKGKPDLSVSVSQIGVSDSVPAGTSVTLQCSVLSESRAAELQVLWFRAAPSQSHPQIIYTQHSSSRQCESGSSTHTCVYSFSKNIHSLNDTGTYYCAVAACGKIVFGNGTRVQMENVATAFNPVVISLGTVLVFCCIMICVQALLLHKSKNGQQCRERFQRSAVIHTEMTNAQGRDAVELNYAALHLNERKTKRARKNQERSEAIVYTEVKYPTVTH